jgi:hypothetical protein
MLLSWIFVFLPDDNVCLKQNLIRDVKPNRVSRLEVNSGQNFSGFHRESGRTGSLKDLGG